ncbi:MAG: protein CysJ [Verrucomicrobiaceae bacterium]|nr:protein CysJ [Verrucomicrobiaceae bacterium]
MPDAKSKPAFNRKNPLLAKRKTSLLLTEGCNSKDTWHLEISLQGSGMEFTPGDSLAVLPQNNPQQVDELIAALGCTGQEAVPTPAKEEASLRKALTENYVITTPDKKLLKAITEQCDGTEWQHLLEAEKKAELNDYLWGREIIDLLLAHPTASFQPAEFVTLLKKLNVRLYSVASSLAHHPDEVHLTVAVVEYESFGRKRQGVCSSWLAERIDDNTQIPCFITPGKGFRLPAPDDHTPIIMCGPGTGIAPFRAFIEERKATNAKGDAWLFFGEIHESTCYFYNEEWESRLADGTLSKITTAWSRDQEEKVYIQHKMLEHGAEFWEWLEKGAIFYVCGDAQRMAPDVDKALHTLIQHHGDKSEEESIAYVKEMVSEKRYRRDVY